MIKHTKQQQHCRSTRDEKLATKLGLPYTVAELINCPVDRFNEILHNPKLTHAQVSIRDSLISHNERYTEDTYSFFRNNTLKDNLLATFIVFVCLT